MRVNLFPNNKLISQKLDSNVPERRFLLYTVTYFKNDWEDILRTKNVFLKLTIIIQPTYKTLYFLKNVVYTLYKI